MITLITHPEAVAARQLHGTAVDRWTLIDSDGNSVDVVTGAELAAIVAADQAEYARQRGEDW